MLSWKRMLLPILTVGLFVTPAAAESDHADWEVGFYTGYAFLDDYDPVFPASSFDLDVDFIVGVRGGYWFSPRWSSELSVQTIGTHTAAGMDAEINSYRFNALANFNPGESFQPFMTIGLGDEHLEMAGLSGARNPSWNAGGGLRAWVLEDMTLRIDFRYVWADHDEAVVGLQHNIETTFGLSWAFGGGKPQDADGDGVSDRRDRCPDTPRGATVDTRGCPSDSDDDGVHDGIDTCPGTPNGTTVDAQGCPMDSDGDGVHDGPDRCPGTPKGATVDADGCPRDSDGDGVHDGVDSCPGTPQGVRVDAQGCPRDSDGDGVYDGPDKCPNTAREATVVDVHGCPLDTDGDGVFDGIDKCLGTPRGTKVDAKGCAILFEGERKSLVLENVLFEFDSADLTEESKAILDQLAKPLLESFADVRLEVGGYTDSVGSADYNRTLSQRRAESVVAHLVSAGVDASRLKAKGYGEADPVATNDTDDGRSKNRRVELRRLD